MPQVYQACDLAHPNPIALDNGIQSYFHLAVARNEVESSYLRDLEANNIPISLVFLPAFGVAASVTESQLCALRHALKTNKNPAS